MMKRTKVKEESENINIFFFKIKSQNEKSRREILLGTSWRPKNKKMKKITRSISPVDFPVRRRRQLNFNRDSIPITNWFLFKPDSDHLISFYAACLTKQWTRIKGAIYCHFLRFFSKQLSPFFNINARR